MSYIIDALKKSDRERQQEMPSTLQHLYETPPAFKNAFSLRRPRWPWLLLPALFILGLAMQLSNHGISWKSRPTEAENPGKSTPAQDGMAPAGSSDVAPAAAEGQSEARLAVRMEWFDDVLPHVPKKDFSVPVEDGSAPGETAGDAAPPVEKIVATQNKKAPKTIRKDREKILLSPQDETTVISKSQAAAIISGKPQAASVPAPPQPAPPAGGSQAGPSRTRSSLPYLQDLPAQVQAGIPKLQFAGHAYATEPSQRLIVINGMIVREGDPIDAATKLVEITWEGVIIDSRGVRFQMKCY